MTKFTAKIYPITQLKFPFYTSKRKRKSDKLLTDSNGLQSFSLKDWYIQGMHQL